MSLARDVALFADQVNEKLDELVNDMAAQATEQDAKLDKAKTESNALMSDVFERLGFIAQKLEGLAKLEADVTTVKRLVTSIHDGHVGDMRDVRKRLGVLEAKAIDVTHPDEEVTPRPGPSLPR